MRYQMPFVYLLAVQDNLADAFRSAFADTENVVIIQDYFDSFMASHPDVDGIVSPANSFGMMSGGLDKALRDYFGKDLQEAVRNIILTEWFGEQTVGTGIAVDIPGFAGKKLIHTPTMRTPSAIIDYQTVYLCMRSALMAAIKAGVQHLMVPPFGAGTGQVPVDVIAQNMREAYEQIKDQLDRPHKETFRTARNRSIIRGNECDSLTITE